MNALVKLVLLSMSLVLLGGCAQTQTMETTEGLKSGIKGMVRIKEEGAAAGVFVYAYDSPFNDMRVPTDYISPPTAADGTYTFDLPPGTYYIVARKRVSGDPKGYLVKGDYEGKYLENPVVVVPGDYTTGVDIPISRLEGAFLLAPYLPDEGDIGISGMVTNEDGTPAKGAYVLIYRDAEMIGMPVYLSRPTNSKGEYTMYLPEAGTYYVAARPQYGGLPRKGEPYGMYDGDPEHKVVLEDKTLMTGVDIKLTPFPFDLIKKPGQ